MRDRSLHVAMYSQILVTGFLVQYYLIELTPSPAGEIQSLGHESSNDDRHKCLKQASQQSIFSLILKLKVKAQIIVCTTGCGDWGSAYDGILHKGSIRVYSKDTSHILL